MTHTPHAPGHRPADDGTAPGHAQIGRAHV